MSRRFEPNHTMLLAEALERTAKSFEYCDPRPDTWMRALSRNLLEAYEERLAEALKG